MTALVAIAKIVRTRGLKGEVVATVLTDFRERFESLGTVIGVGADGEGRELKIEDFWFQKDHIILKFNGHDSVEEAELLRGVEICIAESDVVPLDADEYYDWQLAGCRVQTAAGLTIGRVRELMRTGGTELLVVEDGEREYLIPFAKSICVEVDIENEKIVIDPPEGLLEFRSQLAI